MKIYRSGDNGKTARQAVGDEFEVRLRQNNTTPYRWQLGPFDTSALEQVKSDYVYRTPPGKRGMKGVGGIGAWRFTAKAAGDTTIRLAYRRIGARSSGWDFTMRVSIH